MEDINKNIRIEYTIEGLQELIKLQNQAAKGSIQFKNSITQSAKISQKNISSEQNILRNAYINTQKIVENIIKSISKSEGNIFKNQRIEEKQRNDYLVEQIKLRQKIAQTTKKTAENTSRTLEDIKSQVAEQTKLDKYNQGLAVDTLVGKAKNPYGSLGKQFGMTPESIEKYKRMFKMDIGENVSGLTVSDKRGGLLGKNDILNEETKKQTINNTNALNEYIAKNARFGQVLRMNSEQYQKFNQSGHKFNRIGAKFGNWLRKSTAGMKGFRMEMLGVMFFGMSLTRVIRGLTSTAMEWYGVNEVLTTALGILFLPVAETLLNWALWFLEVVSNLTDTQKQWLKWVVLGIGILGTFLTVAGTVVLGIGSMMSAFTVLLSPLAILVGLFAVIMGIALWKTFAKTGTSIDGVTDKLVENGIVSQEMIDSMISGFKNLYTKVKYYMSDKWPTIWANFKRTTKEVFSKIWSWIKPILSNVFSKIVNFIKTKLPSIGKTIKEYLFGKTETMVVDGNTVEIHQNGLIDKIKKQLKQEVDSEDTEEVGTTLASRIVNGFKKFFINNPGVLVGGLIGAIRGGTFGATIGAAIGLGLQDVDTTEIDQVAQTGKDLLSGIVQGFEDNKEGITSMITTIVSTLAQWVSDNIDTLVDIGFSIGKSILKGIWSGLTGGSTDGSNTDNSNGSTTQNADKVTKSLNAAGTITGGILGGVVTGGNVLGILGGAVGGNLLMKGSQWVGNQIGDLIDTIGTSYWEKQVKNVLPSVFKNLFSKNTLKGEDMFISPSGTLLSTAPDDYLIATKDPYGLANGSGSTVVTVSPTYNVTVSDKREFQEMIERNNRSLTADIRKIAKV